MAWVALSLIFLGLSLSSINQREQISTPVTLAVTMTMSFRISSRYKSEVMAWLMSIKALMNLSYISGDVFSIKRQLTTRGLSCRLLPLLGKDFSNAVHLTGVDFQS